MNNNKTERWFEFPADATDEEIQYIINHVGHRTMCCNTLWGQLEPQEGMKQATGLDEEDWNEYEKYLDGKLPLERDR